MLKHIANSLRMVLVFATLGIVAVSPSPADPPNIVVVLYDDADKAALDHMPNIQQLVAGQGAAFDRFYATQAICCPSRASLLTGEYVHNHRVESNSPPDGGFEEFRKRGHEDRSIAKAMQAQGYRTAYFGKYLNGYGLRARPKDHVPPFWDRWFGSGGQRFYNYFVVDDGTIRHFGRDQADHADTVVTQTARSWIEDTADAGGGPFFAVVSPKAPHYPYIDPPGHTTEFKGHSAPSVRLPSFNERSVEDKPAYVRELAPLSWEDEVAINKRYRHRLRMMLETDDFVGELVASLESRGVLDNTFIVVSSDNGWMQGEHRIPKTKLYPYEEVVRLPLFVRGPGITAAARIDELASMIDLYPTFLDIGGAPSDRDGRSLLPLLEGTTTDWRTQILIENQDHSSGPLPHYFGVVTERFKYVRYSSGEREFYDLVNDPNELHSRKPSREREASLSRKLEALRTCSSSSCRVADSAP